MGLLQRADGKQCGRELALAQGVQKVGLILRRIDGPQQLVDAIAFADLCVVAGGDPVGAQRTGGIQKGLELDLAIAHDVRIRRPSDAVFVQEVGEDTIPVLGGKIARVERNTELTAHCHRIFAVDIRGTRSGEVVFFPVLHEQAFDLVTGLLQQQACHRGIDATRDTEHHFHATGPVLRQSMTLSGKRCPDSHASMLRRMSGLRRRSPSAAISLRVSHNARVISGSSGRCTS